MSKKEIVFYVLCSLFCMWIVASFIDVVNHNLTDCIYKSWNFFKIIVKYA